MAHTFATVPSINIPRSRFDLSSTLMTDYDSGYLVPIFTEEVLPGDSFDMYMDYFMKLSSPTVVPIMDNVYHETFWFYCPRRLLWEHWENMMGQVDNPFDGSEPTDFNVPMIKLGKVEAGDFFNHLGAPIGDWKGQVEFDACYARMYQRLWNEWFRDENLQEPVKFTMVDAPEVQSDFKLLPRGKRKDYFTSCLPWPQKFTAPTIQVGGGLVPVYGDGHALAVTGYNTNTQLVVGNLNNTSSGYVGAQGTPGALLANKLSTTPNGYFNDNYGIGVASKEQLSGKPSGLVVNLDSSVISPITINQLREAFAVQRLLEDFARGGTRYTEILRSCFKVVSPDSRLQRVEFLGSTSDRILSNPVAQTSATDTAKNETPQGNLTAFMQTSSSGKLFSRSFTEHGIIMGLAVVRADLNYQQGLPKRFQRKSIYEFYWPQLANLGEQPVYQSEIYLSADPEQNKKVFGYQERWAEYRYKPNVISGNMASNAPQSLDVYHLAQNFGAPPVLNAAFIEDKPPIDRIVSIPSIPQWLCDYRFTCLAARPLPTFSVPGLVGHF